MSTHHLGSEAEQENEPDQRVCKDCAFEWDASGLWGYECPRCGSVRSDPVDDFFAEVDMDGLED
jgi:Zn finger protein HypA/HybF involved in hydrogenase expression